MAAAMHGPSPRSRFTLQVPPSPPPPRGRPTSCWRRRATRPSTGRRASWRDAPPLPAKPPSVYIDMHLYVSVYLACCIGPTLRSDFLVDMHSSHVWWWSWGWCRRLCRLPSCKATDKHAFRGMKIRHAARHVSWSGWVLAELAGRQAGALPRDNSGMLARLVACPVTRAAGGIAHVDVSAHSCVERAHVYFVWGA